MPPKIAGRNTKDILLEGVGTPTYKSVDKFLNAFGSAGIFEGGTISDSGSGQVDIAAAKGVIRTTNSETGKLIAFDIAATTDVALTDNSMNYIYIDYNSGTPIYAVTTTYENINFNTQIIIGRVYRASTVLYISNVGQDIQNSTLRDLYRIQYVRKMEWGSGAALSFASATRQPTVSGGVYFSNYDKVITSPFDASAADRFTAWYRNGSGGWTLVGTQQNVDNANYDDGDGTLGALGTGDYGVHWVYQLVDGSIHIQYGQSSYTSIANARNSTVPTSQPPAVTGLGILIGRLIILRNATAIYEASSAFASTFTGTATTQHNDLANIQGGVAGEYYHVEAPDIPATGRYRNVYGIDNGDTNVSNKAMFDDAATPVMDGSAATGIQMTVARRDHVHPSDTSRIALSTIDAKGDLLVGSAADTISRLAVGSTNGHVLTIDSAEATGLKWAAAGSGSAAVKEFRRTIEGELYPTVLMFYRVNATSTITEARASIGAIPSGASVKVDVRKLDSGNASNTTTASIFTSDTPIELLTSGSLTYGTYSLTGTLDSGRTSCAAGDLILIVVTQVGSTSAGQDLEVVITF